MLGSGNTKMRVVLPNRAGLMLPLPEFASSVEAWVISVPAKRPKMVLCMIEFPFTMFIVHKIFVFDKDNL